MTVVVLVVELNTIVPAAAKADGANAKAADYIRGRWRLDLLRRTIDDAFRDVDVVVLPTRRRLANVAHDEVVLAAGSFGYDPRDDAEVVRIARLIADEPEVASLDHDDLRTALASVRNGSTFTF